MNQDARLLQGIWAATLVLAWTLKWLSKPLIGVVAILVVFLSVWFLWRDIGGVRSVIKPTRTAFDNFAFGMSALSLVYFLIQSIFADEPGFSVATSATLALISLISMGVERGPIRPTRQD